MSGFYLSSGRKHVVSRKLRSEFTQTLRDLAERQREISEFGLGGLRVELGHAAADGVHAENGAAAL